tara:strand:+ start:10169 stop:10285 length:117 start_codon:yes stop_codon:yes gene_type:complete
MWTVYIEYKKLCHAKEKASRTLHALALENRFLPAVFAV